MKPLNEKVPLMSFIKSLSLKSTILGALFFIMSQTAATAANGTLVLETSQGQIEIEMLPDVAPMHVARISELASSGFYDGIIFHRIIAGFMAQTGDPPGTVMGGSVKTLRA